MSKIKVRDPKKLVLYNSNYTIASEIDANIPRSLAIFN